MWISEAGLTVNQSASEAVADRAPEVANSQIALAVDNVTKSFGNITAIQGASLQVAAGRVTALVGDNGAGKSTLVKIMSGLILPDSGSVLVDGKPVDLRDPRSARQQGIHTVFQDLGLVGSLSIAENMFLCTEIKLRALGIRTPFLDREAMRTEARNALDNLGITTVKDIDAPVESLSGGQRQVVAIARAVREQARVVILDEPTAALGVAQAAQVLRLMERLRAAGTGVLVVSHNLREVFAVADYVVVLRLGKVSQVFETSQTDEEEVVGAIMGAKPKGRA
jgi:ABC-type sugar transport system ATPase subunit